MRKTFLFCSLLISLNLFGQSKIKIKVVDIKDSVAYLGYHFADKRFVLDTVVVENNSVEFTKSTSFKTGLYFLYTPNVYFEFIVNEKEIELESVGPNYFENLKVISSEENKIFQEMQLFVSSKRKKYKEITESMKEINDSSKISSDNKLLANIDKEVFAYQRQIAIDHPDFFVSKMMMAMQKPLMPDSLLGEGKSMELKRYEYYKSHYFDGIDIADPGLLRTPLLNQKIIEYLDKVVLQDADSVIKEVDWLIESAKANEETYRYLLVTLSNKYESSPIMGQDEVFVHIIEKYYLTGKASWVDDELIGKLTERIASIKPNFIGNKAPALILTDTLFSSVSLYEIGSDYIVLYFYDPDCGHCKVKTPLLHDAYARLQSKNVEILAINITTNRARWLEYIKANDLQWINLMDEKGTSNFRYFYDVRSTPTVFILDKNKKIIAKKIDADQVEDFINKSIERGL